MKLVIRTADQALGGAWRVLILTERGGYGRCTLNVSFEAPIWCILISFGNLVDNTYVGLHTRFRGIICIFKCTLT